MNRLWVRLSLAFAAVVLIVSLVGGFMAYISLQPNFSQSCMNRWNCGQAMLSSWPA